MDPRRRHRGAGLPVNLVDLFDFKLLLALVTAPFWMPLARELWAAVDPYPGWGTPDRQRDRRIPGDLAPPLPPLENEEWARWKLRRRLEEQGLDPDEVFARSRAEPPRIRRAGRALTPGSARRLWTGATFDRRTPAGLL